jgi:hypothetical protein
MISLNGTALVSLVLRLPFVGVWTADVEVPATTAPTGAVVLTADTGETFHGTVIAGGLAAGVWRGVVVGGAGGLRRDLAATHYQNATLADVLADALAEAGETRSAGGADLTASAVARWTRRAAPAARTVADVARAAGAPWRVLADGSVWVGSDAWDDLALGDVTVVQEDRANGRYALTGETFSLRPGVVVLLRLADEDLGVRVGDVVHRLGLEGLTSSAWAA